MENYIVSYWIDGENYAFACQADNIPHADEQCENAYPNCFISETYLENEDY